MSFLKFLAHLRKYTRSFFSMWVMAFLVAIIWAKLGTIEDHFGIITAIVMFQVTIGLIFAYGGTTFHGIGVPQGKRTIAMWSSIFLLTGINIPSFVLGFDYADVISWATYLFMAFNITIMIFITSFPNEEKLKAKKILVKVNDTKIY